MLNRSIVIVLMTVERIHPKAPVMLIFIAIFTCLPSCINLSNIVIVIDTTIYQILFLRGYSNCGLLEHVFLHVPAFIYRVV